MAVGRPMPPLVLSDDDVQQLQSIVQRAQIVLAYGAGETITAISKQMGLMGMAVGNGGSVTGRSAWRACTMSSGQGGPAPMRMTRWSN